MRYQWYFVHHVSSFNAISSTTDHIWSDSISKLYIRMRSQGLVFPLKMFLLKQNTRTYLIKRACLFYCNRLILLAHFVFVVEALFNLRLWRWKQYFSSKFRWNSAGLQGATRQKLVLHNLLNLCPYSWQQNECSCTLKPPQLHGLTNTVYHLTSDFNTRH